MLKQINEYLFTLVRADSLAVFRFLFGSIMLWEVYRYFRNGWIERYWVEPFFNFKYEWFHWVEPLSAAGMNTLFYGLGLLSIFIAIGFMYRISMSLFFLIFTYTFLLEQARYLNHFYLIILISFIMIFLPAHKSWSVDASIFTNLRKKWIPRWSVFLLQVQIGLVYFFGGIAKLNKDWLTASPMDSWLPRRSDFPLIGDYFEIPEVIWFVSYSGLFLDLLAFPLLMIRKTRPWIILSLVLFHFMNDRLFTIGIFPWFMIAALTIYLPTSWPRQLLKYIQLKNLNVLLFLIAVSLTGAFVASWFHQHIALIPFTVGFLITLILIWDFQKNPEEKRSKHAVVTNAKMSNSVLIGLGVWLILQVLIPLRHIWIPGNPSWTEEGHRFAWHMKLRSKSCDAVFFMNNTVDNQKQEFDKGLYLKDWQQRKMETRPELIAQYATLLSRLNHDEPVYADVICSLNGSESRRLIQSDVDLSQVSFSDWSKNEWVLR